MAFRGSWAVYGGLASLVALGCAEGPDDDPEEAGEEGSDGGDPLPDRFVPARDISVDWVEANQGIGVRIGADGTGVGGADRTAFVLRNRDALIRAFWKIEDDFEPREILAQLHLTFPDDTTEVFNDRKRVEGDSFIGSLSESFFWGVVAEKMVPGLRFRVELYEVEEPWLDMGEPDDVPHLPVEDEFAYVGVEDSYQVMKVVVVPFAYEVERCERVPDTSEETMQRFRDLLFMMNPLERVDFEVHEPVPWTEELESFGRLNTFLSQLRFEEEASPETYYYGLIDACANGIDGVGGQALGIPSGTPDMGDAYMRVSSGLFAGDPEWAAETFVHEVGHSQGRRHVACNGEEGGPDPRYPIEGGDVGEWGFGIIDFQLRHPTVYKDYMTYCHPSWVSTWGWNKVFPTIQALSTWDSGYSGGDEDQGDAAAVQRSSGSAAILMGTFSPDGQQTWQTVPGRVSASSATRVSFEFRGDGQTTTALGVELELSEHVGGERVVVVPVPPRFDTVERIAHRDRDDEAWALVDARDVAIHHLGPGRLRTPTLRPTLQ